MQTSTKNDASKIILLAEDDKLSVSYFKAVLSGEGFEVIHVDNGIDAVETVRNNPDLSVVLMDIKMPQKSGVEAAREIRSFNPDLPLIAQTAFALAGDKESILDAGFNAYITKPVSREDLLAIVKRFL
ncbi:response regulator [Marinilabilia salmonicolor]|uniref:response regulator n=1 Tax=Marinilabilia salmonicolor TaxID=989 RepID=UPI0002EAEB47|nr:response regulator [Marinilabilia salmonicolor]